MILFLTFLLDEIIVESENHKVVLHHVDLSSFTSIRQFATKIIETEPKIDILIHNAGYSGVFSKEQSVDNIEMTMAVNCYGPLLLTHMLIDLMKKSAPSKILIVSSKAHSLSLFNPRKPYHLNPINFWLPLYLYSNSKFAQILVTYELAKRLNGSGVTANIVHPGTINSEIWERAPYPCKIYVSIARKFMKTVEQGIQTTLYAALSKNVEGVTGKYFRNCREGNSVRRTHDEELQKVMWEESKNIIKLTANDPQI